MMDDENLTPGSFYWVCPVFDVDFTPPGFDPFDESSECFAAMISHWTRREQPARFEGYDESGEQKWVFLGQDTDETNWWPVSWVGPEIKFPFPAESIET